MENGIQSNDVVILTGFGPFSVHTENPSWEAVKHLQSVGLGDNVTLIVKRIPVEYEYVENNVRAWWDEHKPKLVVHCGVSGVAKELTLEQLAHNSGYQSEDIKGLLPLNNCCNHNGPDVINSRIEMKKICDAVNASSCCVKAVVSKDPGRYLCDYTYFTSLSIDPHRTAFIHVPPQNKPYSIEQLSEAIKVAILAMLEEVPNVNHAS